MKVFVYMLLTLFYFPSIIGMNLSKILNSDELETDQYLEKPNLVYTATPLWPTVVSEKSIFEQACKTRKITFNKGKDGVKSYPDKIKTGVLTQVAISMSEKTYEYENPDFWSACPAINCQFTCDLQSNKSRVRTAITEHFEEKHKISGEKIIEQPMDFNDVQTLKNPIFYYRVKPRTYSMHYDSRSEEFIFSMHCDGCNKMVSAKKITDLVNTFKKYHVFSESQGEIQQYITSNSERFKLQCCIAAPKKKQNEHIAKAHMKIKDLVDDTVDVVGLIS